MTSAVPILAASPVTSAQMMSGQSSTIMDSYLMNSWGLTQKQICDLRNKGWCNSDIMTAAVIAKKSDTPLDTVVSEYEKIKTWERVAEKHGMKMDDVRAAMSSTQMSGAGPSSPSSSEITTSGTMAISDAGPCGKPSSTEVCFSGPCAPPQIRVLYGKNCNILLHEDEVNRLYAAGFDWLDVAVAANIARETGLPIPLLLNRARNGRLWSTIALETAVPYSTAFNVTNYPFARACRYPRAWQEYNMRQIAKYQVPVPMQICSTTRLSSCPPCPPSSLGAGPGTNICVPSAGPPVCPPPSPPPCPPPCPPTTAPSCPPPTTPTCPPPCPK